MKKDYFKVGDYTESSWLADIGLGLVLVAIIAAIVVISAAFTGSY